MFLYAILVYSVSDISTLIHVNSSTKLDLRSTAIWDYAEAFATLVRSGLLGKLDPKVHQVVLCGHSAGSIAVCDDVYSSTSDRVFNSRCAIIGPWRRHFLILQVEFHLQRLFWLILRFGAKMSKRCTQSCST